MKTGKYQRLQKSTGVIMLVDHDFKASVLQNNKEESQVSW
jgi:hypothetical protein